ncbi:MAG: hypothetical protein LBD01_06250 [Puniceicoccales bacterium]|nr:hypothetical protein [Puniceicoccales bacterium]
MLMRQNVVEKIQVPVPEALLKAHGRQWRAIVVFGDERDATAVLIAPSKNDTSREHPLWYDFPERALCSKDSKPRPMDETRLLEIRCKTRLSDYPYFTLFARLPDGVTKASEARGIFCLSLLANQISDVRLSLLNRDARGEVAEMIRYADEEKLIILCWGSRRLWDPGKNWDELPKREAREIDTRFDAVASAWESGIKRLSQMYGFETENFLLWGFSGSAQYAMRLAMRKPQYFSAVALQIPSSFDLPTSEAASVLWCLVTGEGESGYYRSQRFYRQCRLKGYRFLYKAVPGLGHQMHVGSMTLAKEFLAYAHSLPKKKEQREAQLKKEMDTPMFYGDWLNQNVESSSGALSIPDRLRVALPTERLVYFWEMKPISGMPRPRSFPVAPILKQGAVSKETAEKLPSANIHSQGS